MSPRRGTEHHRDGPLVLIEPARLRAAIRWRGFKVQTLARWAVVPQATLEAIYRHTGARQRRTRAPARARIARELGCPDRWLGGQGPFFDGPPWSRG